MLDKGPDQLGPANSGWRNNSPPRSVAHANVLMQTPTEALRQFVKRFVVVEFPFARKLRLLSDTNLVAEFRFRGEHVSDSNTNLPRVAISGLWDTARTRTYAGGSAILMAMFTEAGASSFLREPLDSLFNTT